MASKKIQINNPLFGTSEVDPTMDSNSSSSSEASYVGPMTRGRTKALVEGVSKDVVGLVKEMFSQPTLSQTSESILEIKIVEEENKLSNDSEFSFSENIHTSTLRDSPHSVSSFAMPVMMTSTTSLEEQVSTIAQTLEELMKSMKEREALRDAQITLLIDKMGNTSRLNREDESFRPKQTNNDKPESSTKDLNFSTDGSISPDQLKELIKEAIKDQIVGGNDTQEEAQVIVSPSSKEVNLHSKTSRIDSPIEEKKAKPIEEKETKQTKTSTKEKKHQASKVTKAAPVLHYVSVTKRKEGQSPFSGDGELVLEDLQGLTFPVAKITKSRISSQPLEGFARPSQGSIVEHGTLPTKRTKEGFDPNACRLMAKASYDHEKPSGLGKLIPKASGKEEHKVLKAKDFSVTSSKDGIGYTPTNFCSYSYPKS
nr:hypothetical protein CFP56_59821 [Quercus suber]